MTAGGSAEAAAGLQLVVMAAGVGSRFGGLKQLAAVGPGGEVLLDYAVHDALRAGVRRLVIVVRPEMEAAFERAAAARYARRVEVRTVLQRQDDIPAELVPVPPTRIKPWGTGHAVLAARAEVDAPFIVVNADDLYGPEGFSRLAAVLTEPGADESETYGLVAYRLGQTLSTHGAVSRGICEIDADGWLVDIVEHTGITAGADGIAGLDPAGRMRRFTGAEPVSMNLWGFRPTVFAHLAERFERFLRERGQDPTAEFFLPHAVAGMMRDGHVRVRVVPTGDTWLGVTYPQDLETVRLRLREMIGAGAYTDPLWTRDG